MSKKLRTDELFLASFASSRLKMELDRIPLWRGDHVAVKQLAEDFARYLYLPRLKNPSVLLNAISDGASLLAWSQDSFGVADSYDEASQRYQGLRGGTIVMLADVHSAQLLIKPDVASKQIDSDSESVSFKTLSETEKQNQSSSQTDRETPLEGKNGSDGSISAATKPKRFHGTATLDPARAGRDASKIADEVISHLVGLVDANVTVTIEIEAQIPKGAPDNVVRTVTENARTLKFTNHGFEKE